MLCPHRNAWGELNNPSDKLFPAQEAAEVGSENSLEGPWRTADRCTAPEHMEQDAASFL